MAEPGAPGRHRSEEERHHSYGILNLAFLAQGSRGSRKLPRRISRSLSLVAKEPALSLGHLGLCVVLVFVLAVHAHLIVTMASRSESGSRGCPTLVRAFADRVGISAQSRSTEFRRFMKPEWTGGES